MDTQMINSTASLREVELPFGGKIFQDSSSHGVSSDTARLVFKILEDNQQDQTKMLDIGTGSGIIALMSAHYRPQWMITGIDIQTDLINLARANAITLKKQINFVTGDLRDHDLIPEKFDIVSCNPPYYPVDSGRISPKPQRAIARHEITCSLPEVIEAVARYLKPEGRAYLLYPASRLPEIEKTAKKVDLKIAEKIISADIKEPTVITVLFYGLSELNRSDRI
ncbi:MAG: methyltransferase domain-containing protein [Candidatus Cloacimonetes bacterium]|nr:methyltransferase domain-containing protein [Candidatus Cloacimonadota bacterium]